MPGIYRSRHYLDNLSNHRLMNQIELVEARRDSTILVGAAIFGDATCPRSALVASLTPRDGGAYDPLLGPTT